MNIKSVVFSLVVSITAIFAAGAQAQQTLKVGSTPTGVPFSFLDTKTNTIEGAMVDIVRAVGKEVGFAVQIDAMPFSALIGSLTAKRIDLISAAMLITPARQEVVSFSDPIYRYGEGLILSNRAPQRRYETLADLKGLSVGVQVGTAYVEPLQKIEGVREVKLYDGAQDMIRDLNVGRIEAGLLDYPIAAYILSQGNTPNVRMEKSYKPSIVASVGIAANKDNPELIARVNKALARLKADGTIGAILKKWGLGT